MAGATSPRSEAGTADTAGSSAPSMETETARSTFAGNDRGTSTLICCGLAYAILAGTALKVTLAPHRAVARLGGSALAVQFARLSPSRVAYAPGARLGDRLAAFRTA